MGLFLGLRSGENQPMEPNELTLNDLIQFEAIKQAKYRYLRCLDQKLWDELTEVLTEDCVAAYSGGTYSFEGRAAIMDFLQRAMGADTFHSSHRCHHPELRLESPTSASGTWAMDDVVIITDLDVTVRGAAFYEDEYRNEGGVWRISRTGYKRTYEELQPRSSIEGMRLTASWWSTDGRSELPAV